MSTLGTEFKINVHVEPVDGSTVGEPPNEKVQEKMSFKLKTRYSNFD